MPKYVPNNLHGFQHPKTKQPQRAAHQCELPNYVEIGKRQLTQSCEEVCNSCEANVRMVYRRKYSMKYLVS